MKWDVVFEPQIDIGQLYLQLIELVSFVHGISAIPLPPRLRENLDTLNILRAIKGTTGLEGNTVSDERLAEILKEPTDQEYEDVEEQEIRNADNVLRFIREMKQDPKALITEELIKKIHKLTTENCNYPDNIPGEYRTDDVYVGTYFFPDHEKVPGLMKTFVEFINSKDIAEYPAPIRAIMAHFYLVSIHPFQDGNGRTARGVEAYILYQGQLNALGFYSLANYYYSHRKEYIAELQDARFKHNGRLTPFMRFSLNGFIEELKKVRLELNAYIVRLTYRDYVHELLVDKKINSRIAAILDRISKSARIISLEEFKAGLIPGIKNPYKDKTERTAYNDLKQMEKLQLVTVQDKNIYPNFSLMDKFQI